MRSRDFTPGTLKSALIISPHPDDESLGCGGTAALLSRSGVRVSVLFVTDGGGSHPGHTTLSPSKIAVIRREEACSAADALGIDLRNVTFLGAEDGTLGGLDEGGGKAIADRLEGLLRRARPDTVLLPCRRDGSSEHEATFILFQAAMRRSGGLPRVLEFPVWAWRNPLRLLRPMISSRTVWRVRYPGMMEVKRRALGSHASQVLPLPPDPRPALPPDFVAEFQVPEEFLFER